MAVLKAGTAVSTPRPRKNMVLRSSEVVLASLAYMPPGEMTFLPRNIQPVMASGMRRLTSEGMNSVLMICIAVI